MKYEFSWGSFSIFLGSGCQMARGMLMWDHFAHSWALWDQLYAFLGWSCGTTFTCRGVVGGGREVVDWWWGFFYLKIEKLFRFHKLTSHVFWSIRNSWIIENKQPSDISKVGGSPTTMHTCARACTTKTHQHKPPNKNKHKKQGGEEDEHDEQKTGQEQRTKILTNSLLQN